MGVLRVKKIDFNSKEAIENLKTTVQDLIKDKSAYYILSTDDKNTFQTLHKNPPKEPGWYIILNDYYSIYVGQASKDLNDRINIQTDGFHHTKRKSDDKRNFIKKYIAIKIFEKPYVCVLTRKKLCDKLGIRVLPNLDFNSIEKVLDIFRGQLNFLKYDDVIPRGPSSVFVI
jgi:hypothetical protein